MDVGHGVAEFVSGPSALRSAQWSGSTPGAATSLRGARSRLGPISNPVAGALPSSAHLRAVDPTIGSAMNRPMITEASGPCGRDSSGDSSSTACSVAAVIYRSNGAQPSTAKNSVAPSDQRSAAGVTSAPSMRSGGHERR